jgi:hypothetical protein
MQPECVRGLPVLSHSSPWLLAFLSTPETSLEFWSLSETSEISGDLSGVPKLHPIPFGLALPHFKAHHCTVPSHTYSVYVFSCIPSKVSLEYSLWIIPC